jgi:hypothetical protein
MLRPYGLHVTVFVGARHALPARTNLNLTAQHSSSHLIHAWYCVTMVFKRPAN